MDALRFRTWNFSFLWRAFKDVVLMALQLICSRCSIRFKGKFTWFHFSSWPLKLLIGKRLGVVYRAGQSVLRTLKLWGRVFYRRFIIRQYILLKRSFSKIYFKEFWPFVIATTWYVCLLYTWRQKCKSYIKISQHFSSAEICDLKRNCGRGMASESQV